MKINEIVEVERILWSWNKFDYGEILRIASKIYDAILTN